MGSEIAFRPFWLPFFCFPHILFTYMQPKPVGGILPIAKSPSLPTDSVFICRYFFTEIKDMDILVCVSFCMTHMSVCSNAR